MNTGSKVWLITGVSGGLGRALAIEAAENGHIVYGTLRKREQLPAFNELVPGKTFGVLLDVNQHDQIGVVLQTILSEQGKIDILVNNAGYGLFGAIEEASIAESRAQMETNFFGALAVTQALLPVMREQGSGHIIQISSIAGINATPGLGIYNASKFALEGFSEALAIEVKPLGIAVTLVEPGPFRTDWAGASSIRAKKVIEAYDATAGERLRILNNINGRQPGDPVKGARAIIKITETENPPLRLALGQIAVDGVRIKIRQLEKDLNEWEPVSLDTAFDA